MEAFRRLYEAAVRGGRRGWGHDDPIGLDPDTRRELRQPGGVFQRPVGFLNEAVSSPVIAAGDMALRGGNAALHGAAAVAGQAAEEIGSTPGMGRRLERDLLGMAQMATGGAGRAPSIVARGNAQSAISRGSRYDLSKDLERLIQQGGRPVKVGEISAEQLADIRRAVPDDAGALFEAADGSIYATEGLLNSLRSERPKHADRLIMGMPSHLRDGAVRGNPRSDRAHRPIVIRPGPNNSRGQQTFDVMILDAADGEIGVPSIFTSPQRAIDKDGK